MSRRALSLTVDVPRPEADRPAWGKVGLIAAAGFAIGILWPRLTHTRIAPNPPNESGTPALVDLRPATSASASTASPASSTSTPAAEPARAPGGNEDGNVTVSAGVILHCRDAREKLEDGCGSLEFDPVAVPRIKALARCPAAAGVTGKLSIGFDVDFRDKSVKVLLGKSSTLPHAKGEALIRCADKAFDKVSIGEVPHDHRRYTLFYTASFASGASPARAETSEASFEGRSAGNTVSESPASGTATVSWDVAIVRDAPKTGNIVARVLRGSKVKVLAHQGDWYKVQSGAAEGWVYRGTIGL